MLFISTFWFPMLICWLINIDKQKGEINNIHRLDLHCEFYTVLTSVPVYMYLTSVLVNRSGNAPKKMKQDLLLLEIELVHSMVNSTVNSTDITTAGNSSGCLC